MSRFNEGYEEQYDNQYALWDANIRRAVKGRKGQKALRELRDALRALSDVAGPRLIEGALCTVGGVSRASNEFERQDIAFNTKNQGEGVCAVGAFAWWKNVQKGMSYEDAFKNLPTLLDTEADIWETAFLGADYGLTKVLAYELAYRNDEYYNGTPEERYIAFLRWLDKVIVDE